MEKRMVNNVLVVIFAFFGHILCDDESELFQTNDLDCWYKPSCNLTQNSNASLIPFVAGCQCDADCIKYDDCCKDSTYYGKSAIPFGKEYTCHPKLEVYMVTSCPESYHNSSLAWNCSFELPIKEVAFVIPVTSKRTHTTYANEYCARCHNDTQYEPWDLIVDYVEITSSFFENDLVEGGVFDSLFAPDDDDPSTERAVDAAAADAVPNAENGPRKSGLSGGRIRIEELIPHVRFYAAQEAFLASHNDRRFICTFESKLPVELSASVRRCLPNLISECPDDDDEEGELCRSYTEIVYDRYNAFYFRNKDCAACNSVPLDDTSFCPQAEVPADQMHGFVISSRNKTRNRRLCSNPIVPRFFCPT